MKRFSILGVLVALLLGACAGQDTSSFATGGEADVMAAEARGEYTLDADRYYGVTLIRQTPDIDDMINDAYEAGEQPLPAIYDCIMAGECQGASGVQVTVTVRSGDDIFAQVEQVTNASGFAYVRIPEGTTLPFNAAGCGQVQEDLAMQRLRPAFAEGQPGGAMCTADNLLVPYFAAGNGLSHDDAYGTEIVLSGG